MPAKVYAWEGTKSAVAARDCTFKAQIELTKRLGVRPRVDAHGHMNFHDLRHLCASIMLGLRIDLDTVSKILGRSTVATTHRYSHMQINAQRAALQK